MRTPSAVLSESSGAGQGAVLRIGDVASAAGVTADTLRFYERRGFLRPTGRRASGYRGYSHGTVRLVRCVRRRAN